MMLLLEHINNNINDKEIKRLLISALYFANKRGDRFLGIPHLLLYMEERKIIDCAENLASILKPFPSAPEMITPALTELTCKVGGLEDFLSLLWEEDLFKILVIKSNEISTDIEQVPDNKVLKSLISAIKRDCLCFFKSLGRVVEADTGVCSNSKALPAVMDGLSQRFNSCVLLTGKAGVGKTTLVSSLQLTIEKGDVHDALAKHIVLELFPHEEGFIQKLFLLSDENVIVFIDEVHTLIQDGTTQKERLKIPQPLKPLISEGRIKLLLATTDGDAGELLKDDAFKRRVKIVRMEEPSKDETIKIANQGLMMFRKSSLKMLAGSVINGLKTRFFRER